MARRKYVKENNLVKAINTDSLELQKPLVNEYYDINVHNSNMDKIDLGYKQNKNDISNINYELSKTENTKYTTENGIKEFSCKDGYVDNIVIEGETLVNLRVKSTWTQYTDSSLGEMYYSRSTVNSFKENTKYTLVNLTDKVIVFEIRTTTSPIMKYSVSSNSKLVIDTTELDLNNYDNNTLTLLVSNGWVMETASQTYADNGFVLLEGDHTDKPITYFEGLKSVGQGDKIEVLTRCEEGNIFDGEMELGSLGTNGVPVDNANCVRSRNFTPIKDTTPFTSWNDKGYGIYFYYYDSAKNFIKAGGEIPSNARYFKFRSILGNVENDLSVKYVISYNSVSQYAQPQQDKKQILTTLHSLPNGVKDTIEKRGNKYYKIKRCVECNPREITYFGRKETYYQIELKISDLPQIANNSIISNLFGNFGNTGGSKDTVFIHPTYEKTIVIQTTNPSITTKELAQTYIENNNFTVVYELATPIMEELPNFNPQTFSDKTTLLLNSGVVQGECDFEVTNSLGSELEALKGKVSDLDDTFTIINSHTTPYSTIQYSSLNDIPLKPGRYGIGCKDSSFPTVYGNFTIDYGSYRGEFIGTFRSMTSTNMWISVNRYGDIDDRGWKPWQQITTTSTLSALEQQVSELEIQLLENEV